MSYEQKVVNVGMFGLGTVGQGVVRYLKDIYDPTKTGLEINLAKICVRDTTKSREVQIPNGVLTTNLTDILDNQSIDVVVEVMGGIQPAGAYVLLALENGKHVVTANKALLTHPRGTPQEKADYFQLIQHGIWPQNLSGYDLFRIAISQERNVGFEASVGGEIPIIDVASGLPSKGIVALEAIINGTSNFILTHMGRGMSYEDALRYAQRIGLAEADPSFDVDGKDAAQKLSILATLVYGHRVDVQNMVLESIRGITEQDITHAQQFGYVIKPLAIAIKYDGKLVVCRVCPTLVPNTHEIASVNYEKNAVSLYFDGRGEPLTLSGMGAGAIPTARSVVADIVKVVTHSVGSRAKTYELFTKDKKADSMTSLNLEFPWYLRLTVSDVPGVMGSVGTILGHRHNINIRKFEQPETMGSGEATIYILTHPALEDIMANAIAEIKRLPDVKESLVMRVKK